MKTYFELLLLENGEWIKIDDKIDTFASLEKSIQSVGDRGIQPGIPKIRFMLQKNEINNI
jgi:hypothetical protein